MPPGSGIRTQPLMQICLCPIRCVEHRIGISLWGYNFFRSEAQSLVATPTPLNSTSFIPAYVNVRIEIVYTWFCDLVWGPTAKNKSQHGQSFAETLHNCEVLRPVTQTYRFKNLRVERSTTIVYVGMGSFYK